MAPFGVPDSRKVYLPWPLAMEIADKLDENGYTQLAREARKAVWDEAERLWKEETNA